MSLIKIYRGGIKNQVCYADGTLNVFVPIEKKHIVLKTMYSVDNVGAMYNRLYAKILQDGGFIVNHPLPTSIGATLDYQYQYNSMTYDEWILKNVTDSIQDMAALDKLLLSNSIPPKTYNHAFFNSDNANDLPAYDYGVIMVVLEESM